MRTLVAANQTREAAVETRVPVVASVTCCNRLESDVVGEESAGGDVEVPTPFTDEQVEFLGSLVERSVLRVLESRENTDTLPSTDLAGADRRGFCDKGHTVHK